MPIVKINKQLDRPDGGKVASGSIAVCNSPRQLVDTKQVVFITPIYLTQTALDDGKEPIPKLVAFPKFKLVKDCTEAEWTALNDDAGAGALVGQFMEECIAERIGAGNTELLG